MSENTQNDDLLDDDVKAELSENKPEDPLLTEYATQQSGSNNEKVDVTDNWIGESDNWQTKTKLSAEQIIAMSQVRMLPKVFPELEEIEDVLIDTVENLEQYAVSHGGLSREQHVSVLRAMHGDEMPDNSAERAAIAQMFAHKPDDDE